MAHAIDFSKGRAAMAFTGNRNAIWHGLGEAMPEDAPIEEWERAAGMDWQIQRSKVRFATSREDVAAPTVWPDYHVLLRSDTKAPLAVVSDSFQVVQPREVLSFFADLIREAGFRLTTAGVLHGGKKFWAQADVGAGDNVVKNDFVGARLLLATACDGSMNTIAKGVSERVVCSNTLGFAMQETNGSMVKVSHRSVFDEAKVKRQLGVAPVAFARFMAQARELAKREVSPEEAQLLTLALMGGVAAPQNAAQIVRNSKVVDSIGYQTVLALFGGKGRGANLPGVAGTAWGLVNGVTEYVDHYQRSRSPDNRMDSAEFGAGDALKTDAFKAALALLD
jgi:phage/plasmid-like protein (TIGR03299 family)